MEPHICPDILYSDASVAVCVKPAGVDSQSGMPALLSALLGGEAFCVHRLDRGVGGVMVYARTPAAAAILSKAVADGALGKTYLAVCEGCPPELAGELRDLLYHDPAKNKSFVVRRPRRGVREAALRYRVLCTVGWRSLVAVRLLTGRTHQIRVQFASRAHPLAGDRRYGGEPGDCIALWSCALSFPDPVSGEIRRFAVPPPEGGLWDGFPKEVIQDALLQA